MAKNVFKSRTVDGIKVSFNINYEYSESITTKDLKSGENILDFNNNVMQSEITNGGEHIQYPNGNVVVTAGNNGVIRKNDGNNIVMHETTHLVGLADRYDVVDGENLGKTIKYHHKFEMDLMANPYQYTNLNNAHYSHYVESYGKMPYISHGYYNMQVGRTKTGRLKTPYEKNGIHKKITLRDY